jgi:hypothetical protein
MGHAALVGRCGDHAREAGCTSPTAT